MNQRIHNLSKWVFLKEGESLAFPKRKPRLVVLEVNCPTEVCFYVSQDPDAVRENPQRNEDEEAGRFGGSFEPLAFLGIAKGRDRFEFSVDGPFELLVEGGSAYVYTADGQDIVTRVVAPVIFTRIANRRQRNPHLELIQYQMRMNTERMMHQLEAESTRRIQALEQRLERYAQQRDQRIAPEDLAAAARRERSEPGSSSEGAPAADDGVSEGNPEPPSVKGNRKKKAEADVDG